jgi:hypothetical protein
VSGDRIQATQYLINNAFRIVNRDIPDISYINTVAGEEVITAKSASVTRKTHPVFQITDKDLQKQEKIKAIRMVNSYQVHYIVREILGVRF